jgi:cobyrinic acid a,c-diamide synthase
MQNIPRLIIAAPMSGSGKTTITAALIAAFTARGLRVAPFKVGPDYIDPTYHARAAGRVCANLDAWMLPPERVRDLFAYRAQDADLALVEGVMGLFDGYSGDDDAGSTAHIARLLDAPVLLVLDASAMARSAAAIVLGVRDFDPRVCIAGVILNRVGSARHAEMIQCAVEARTGIPVVGFVTRDDAVYLPERHLGLIPTNEPGRWNVWLETARAKISSAVNLDQILQLARAAPPLADTAPIYKFTPHRAVIAVARDEAFGFLYEDNLDLLRAAGAEIVFFSPLRDSTLPRGAQALYLAGGFPEIYAAELADNVAMRAKIRLAFYSGVPIYAECGGLMYLTEEIVDQQNVAHAMVGVLPGRSTMTERLTLGYRTVRAARDSWLWRAGEIMRGHEFHYSVWQNHEAKIAAPYQVLSDDSPRAEGAQIGDLIASYVHLHFLAQLQLAERFVQAACAQEGS